MKERARQIVRLIAAIAMIAIGVDHFAHPDFFVRIVPRALPVPLLLVQISGVFEVLGGAGLLVPARVRGVRRAAGVGLVLLYIAVFPANINMVVHPELGGNIPLWALWLRLPFQLLFIATALWVSQTDKTRSAQPTLR